MEEALFRYLREHIPLTAAMGVEVRAATPERVVLAAPLAPNVNHQATAFGGSIATLGVLAGWSWLWIELGDPRPELVVARAECDYRRPISGEIVAETRRPASEAVARFRDGLLRRGKARIDLRATIGEGAAILSGTYAAIARSGPAANG